MGKLRKFRKSGKEEATSDTHPEARGEYQCRYQRWGGNNYAVEFRMLSPNQERIVQQRALLS
jgi:hypothetical protein